MEQKQIFPNEVEAHLNLREPKGSKPTIIYLVVRARGKQYKFSIGCKVYPSQWDKKKQRAFISPHLSEVDNRNNSIVNNKISHILFLFSDTLQYICQCPDEDVNFVEHLRERLKLKETRKTNKRNALIEMGKLVDEQAMSKGSKYGYQCEINTFTAFIKRKYGKSILYWDEITLSLLTEYEAWLHQQVVKHPITHKTVYMEDNTVIGKMTKIYTILTYAERKELIDLQTSRINRLKEKKTRKDKTEENQIYLTEEELTAMWNLNLCGDMEKVRDLFCFQNEIGQRYEDINGISPEVIKNNKIKIIQKKTSTRVTPPITEIAKQVLEKYNYHLPKIQPQKANKILKMIAKQAGIIRTISRCEMRNGEQYRYDVEGWQCVGTHTARRSYVSNGLKTYDSSVLKKVTGHSTSSAFERYNRLDSEDAADIVIKKSVTIKPQQSQSVPVTSVSMSLTTIDYIERTVKEKIVLENTLKEQAEQLQRQNQETNIMRQHIERQGNELKDYQDTFSDSEYADKIGDLAMQAEQDEIFLFHEQP